MTELDETIILKYLEDECSDEELSVLNSWLDESEENRHFLFGLKNVLERRKLNHFSDTAFLDRAEEKLFQKINQIDASSKKTRIPTWIKYISAAAISVGILWGISYSIKNNPFIEDSIIVSVPANGEVEYIILPDSSKVWLQKGTTLKYPKEFGKSNRNISLTGEAYFEVTKNPKMPFHVDGESMHVKVLGTKFNMKCNKNDKFAEASLIEGEIEVKGANNEGLIVLSPGQKAELNLNSKRLQVKMVNTKLDAVWHNNLISFDNANIVEIANALETLYDITITISPDIKLNRYSGTLKKKDDIASVLKSLRNSIPIEYKITGKQVYIYSKQ